MIGKDRVYRSYLRWFAAADAVCSSHRQRAKSVSQSVSQVRSPAWNSYACSHLCTYLPNYYGDEDGDGW